MMRLWRALALVAVLAFGSLALTACGGQPKPESTTATQAPTAEAAAEPTKAMPAAETTDLGGRKIVVGTDATYAPMELEMSDKTIKGIDPSLLSEICKIANCTAEFRSTPWDGIFPALAAGEFDVLMSALTIKPERETNSKAKFTMPYYTVGQVVVVKKSNDAIKGVADLAKATVGVQTGTTGDTAAKDNGVPDEKLNRYDTMPLAVEALKSGDVDAVVADSPTAESYANTFADELKVVGEPFTKEDYGILVSDKFPEILAAFNNAIAKLKADNRIEAIAKPWLVLPPTPVPGAGGSTGSTGAMTGTGTMTGTGMMTGTGVTPVNGQATP